MLVIEIDPASGQIAQVFVRATTAEAEDAALRAWQSVRPLVDAIDLKLKQNNSPRTSTASRPA